MSDAGQEPPEFVFPAQDSPLADVFSGLPRGHFDVVLADPAWKFTLRSDKGQGKSPDRHYECMSLEEIRALPVADLCRSDAVLVLWATFPMLDQARDVMSAWGFTYKTGGAWAKLSSQNGLSFGTGFILRSAAELFLVGTRGSPKTLSKSVRNAIAEPVSDVSDLEIALGGRRREHSRKPEQIHEMVEALWPGEHLEMFARRARRPGWWFWGNEL